MVLVGPDAFDCKWTLPTTHFTSLGFLFELSVQGKEPNVANEHTTDHHNRPPASLPPLTLSHKWVTFFSVLLEPLAQILRSRIHSYIR